MTAGSMREIDISEYERAALGCGAIKGIEFDLLKETLASWKANPGQPHILLDLRDGRTLAAFALITKAQGRDSTFEVRYLVVERDYRNSSGGARILAMIEEEVLRLQPSGLVQIEISRRKLACLGAVSLESSGYRQIGHIPDFYGEGNDYFMYTKAVYRNPPNRERHAAPPGAEHEPAATDRAGSDRANSGGAGTGASGSGAPTRATAGDPS